MITQADIDEANRCCDREEARWKPVAAAAAADLARTEAALTAHRAGVREREARRLPIQGDGGAEYRECQRLQNARNVARSKLEDARQRIQLAELDRRDIALALPRDPAQPRLPEIWTLAGVNVRY